MNAPAPQHHSPVRRLKLWLHLGTLHETSNGQCHLCQLRDAGAWLGFEHANHN